MLRSNWLLLSLRNALIAKFEVLTVEKRSNFSKDLFLRQEKKIEITIKKLICSKSDATGTNTVLKPKNRTKCKIQKKLCHFFFQNLTLLTQRLQLLFPHSFTFLFLTFVIVISIPLTKHIYTLGAKKKTNSKNTYIQQKIINPQIFEVFIFYSYRTK